MGSSDPGDMMPASAASRRKSKGARVLWALTICAVSLTLLGEALVFITQQYLNNQVDCGFYGPRACDRVYVISQIHDFVSFGVIGGALCIVLFAALALWATKR